MTHRLSINEITSDQLDALCGAIDAVRDLHRPMERGPFEICGHCSGWDGEWRCRGVVTDFPCPTVRALDAALLVPATKRGTNNACTPPQAQPDPANVAHTQLAPTGAPVHDCDRQEAP